MSQSPQSTNDAVQALATGALGAAPVIRGESGRGYDELLARIALIMVLYKHSYSAHSHCLQDEHQQLIEYIERKDRDRALALVGSHLSSVESSLMTEETSEAGLLKQVLLRNLPAHE